MGTIGYLLDTHVFLWAIEEHSSKLNDKVKNLLLTADEPIFVSSISAYEITIKHRLGKLPGYDNVVYHYIQIFDSFGAYELPLTSHHNHFAGSLDWSHRDPFDRMLAAQAHLENLTLITNDAAFRTAPWVSVLW
ncbi:MAG: type II toxin-antitoxin system VapC family toxin [Oscillospiraceae bacterium]|nr:type II toxin-antitoxin system VapC family toxin [Oscillospiraceae bacterium]